MVYPAWTRECQPRKGLGTAFVDCFYGEKQKQDLCRTGLMVIFGPPIPKSDFLGRRRKTFLVREIEPRFCEAHCASGVSKWSFGILTGSSAILVCDPSIWESATKKIEAKLFREQLISDREKKVTKSFGEKESKTNNNQFILEIHFLSSCYSLKKGKKVGNINPSARGIQ